MKPKSIRAKVTVIATVLSGVVLCLLGVGTAMLIRGSVETSVFGQTQQAAHRVTAELRAGTLRNPIPADGAAELIQVVDAHGVVVKSSTAAVGRVPVTDLRPAPDVRLRDLIKCPAPGGGCYAIEAARVSADANSPVTLTAVELPPIVSSRVLEAVIAGVAGLLMLLVTWLTWLVTGRTLRPIEEIRAQLSEISGADLSRRVPQPAGENEIAQLARTANETLDRLERSVAQQRQFASDASHELRTPIAGLRANLEDALMHPEDTNVPQLVDAALRDTGRLEAIVTDLLLLASLGTVGAAGEEVDLSDLTRMLKRPDHTFHVTDGLHVHGVRSQITRLISNLLDNADRYGHGETVVEVTRDGDQALVVVSDNGPGITGADRDRVFERFARVDTARGRLAGGIGLGLAIARDIATAHNGALTIEDSPTGARFAFRMPLSPEPSTRQCGEPGTVPAQLDRRHVMARVPT
jgi:signal transduction histidine kinase